MSSVWDVPGLARAVAGPAGVAAPAATAVNTFWPVSKRSTRPKSRLMTWQIFANFQNDFPVVTPGTWGAMCLVPVLAVCQSIDPEWVARM